MMANFINKYSLLAIINHICRLYKLKIVFEGERASIDALKDSS
jgi:hypothetical protein